MLAFDALKAAAARRPLSFHVPLWLAVCVLVVLSFPQAVDGVKVVAPVNESIRIPYHFKNGNGVYSFTATLHKDWLTPNHITVQADDCIQSIALDGKTIFSSQCKPCEHCDFTRIRLPANLEPGPHALSLVTKDITGSGQLDIREANGLTATHLWVLVLGGVAFILLFARRGRPMLHAWMPCLAVLMAVNYHLITDSDLRQHDVGGHKEYIDHLMSKGTLPGVKQGWETWQPPAYYAATAVFVRITEPLEIKDHHRRAQGVAGILYVLVIGLAAFFWSRMGFTRRTGWLGLALFTLMPAHVFISGRVNNDVVMPILGAGLVLLMWHYMNHARLSTLVVVSGLLLLSMMTKTSSMSLVAGAGLTLLWKDHMDGRPLLQRLLRCLVLGVPPALWVAFWFWRNKQQTGEWMYVNASIQDALKIPNDAFKYLWFDLPAFLSEPNFNTGAGKLRESLPTSLAASLLSGEYGLDWIPEWIRTFTRAAFVPLLWMFLLGVLYKPLSSAGSLWLPAIMFLGAHAFFMFSYAWRFPYACNMDARLWSPAYFPAALMFSWGYEVALQKYKGTVRSVLRVAPYIFLAMLTLFWWRLIAG